jgi:DNA processing protein
MAHVKNIEYWLALIHVPGLNDSSINKIISLYPQLVDFFCLKETDYKNMGLSTKSIDYIKKPDWTQVESALKWQESDERHHIISIQNKSYPSLLREIHHPPPILFVEGDLNIVNQPQLAIVGSRNPTPSGLQIAYNLAKDLADSGLVITSGLAEGIDTAAHQGALTTHQTIAVMGTGITSCYPRKNRQLKKSIKDKGAIISQFTQNAPPLGYHFPKRNRIISGLSLGTLVVEANLKSGSLITAMQSLDQGREVFAVPGSILNPRARGCHLLIKQGAKLVEDAEDILEELTLFQPKGSTLKKASLQHKKLDAHHQKLLECMDYEPTKSDVLVARSQLTIQQVTSILVDLELDGFVHSSASGYVRVS